MTGREGDPFELGQLATETAGPEPGCQINSPKLFLTPKPMKIQWIAAPEERVVRCQAPPQEGPGLISVCRATVLACSSSTLIAYGCRNSVSG